MAKRDWFDDALRDATAIDRDLVDAWKATPEEGDELMTLFGQVDGEIVRSKNITDRQGDDWDAVVARWLVRNPKRRRMTRREEIVLFEFFSDKRNWRGWATRNVFNYRVSSIFAYPDGT